MTAQRFYTLDAMRGVAAIAVVSLHLVLQFDLQPKPSSFMAVDFFFMLSGFVLATVYEGRLKRDMTALSFLMARFIRLYPMYFLGMLLGTITLIGQNFAGSGHSLDMTQSIFAMVGFLVLPSPLTSGLFPLNPPAWSLFYEAVINVVFAFGILHLRTRVLTVALFCIGVAYVAITIQVTQMSVGMAWNTFFYGIIRVSFPFGIGVLFARLRTATALKAPALGWLLCVVLVALLLVPQDVLQPTIYNMLVTIVFMPALLWLGIRWQITGTSIVIAEALGDLSYPLYAIHYPLMRMTSFAAKPVHVPTAAFVATFIIVAPLLSLYLARRVDLPMRQWLSARKLLSNTMVRRHAKKRRSDMAKLWPLMKQYYPRLDQAKAKFVSYACETPAWSELGEAGIRAEVDALE